MAVFPEENLLNNEDLVPPLLLEEFEHGYANGYSIATHEMAHCVDMNGLHSAQHQLLQQEYIRKVKSNAVFTDGWRDPKQREAYGCYASHTVYEYFAQLTNTWLGTNHGLDPHFSMCVGSNRCATVSANDIAACAEVQGCDSEHFPRANTQEWIVAHERAPIVHMLEALYGSARLVSFPVTFNAGAGFLHSPDYPTASTLRDSPFSAVYFEVNKATKIMNIYKKKSDVGIPKRAHFAVGLTGAGNMLWTAAAGPASLWRRRPSHNLECVVVTTAARKKFYICQRDVERLLVALNEAIFL